MGFTLRKDGRYCRKVNGRTKYFGRDLAAAKVKYNLLIDKLRNGEVQQPDGFLTVADLLNLFLTRKRLAVESGQIKQETWDSYKTVTDVIAAQLKDRYVASLNVSDFDKLAARLSTGEATTITGRLGVAKMVFFFANETGLLEKPLRYKNSLKAPSKRELRVAKLAKGPRLLSAQQIQALTSAADPELRSMILLGINAGLGNNDCVLLTSDYVEGEWLNYSRPKTGNPRKSWLWPETRKNLAIPFTDWTTESISKAFTKLAKSLDINRTFYDLRRTYATVAFATGLRDATSYTLGHIPPPSDMAAVYRQLIPDATLKQVSEYVRDYVLGRVTL